MTSPSPTRSPGGGALLAALVGTIALADQLTATAWAGLATIVAGLCLLAGRPPTSQGLRWAALTAGAIGCYTILDAAGVRRSTGLTYSSTLALGIAAAVTVTLILRGRGAAMLAAARSQWRRHLLGGAASVTAYAMVLSTARLAPIGYVSPLRETSIVLGAIAGRLLLGEPPGARRASASTVLTAGLILLVATRYPRVPDPGQQ